MGLSWINSEPGIIGF